MIDRPGQGGTLRRHKIVTRADSEVPIGKCIDWLEQRPDVDRFRIAVCGSSLGGYYAARAACYERRLAAAISHGAIWSVHDMWGTKGDDFGLAMHIRWVFGAGTMAEAHELMKPFTLKGHLEHMACPYLVLHGGHDVLTVTAARSTFDYARGRTALTRQCGCWIPRKPALSIASTTIRPSARKCWPIGSPIVLGSISVLC
jgi:hypothetical protein